MSSHANQTTGSANTPMQGLIPYSIGQASAARIPIPGTDGLCLEFSPRGKIPKGGSTSSLFFQDIKGKRHLRLDYGCNVKTNTIDFHWNQAGTHKNFGIADHSPTGRGGKAAHSGARYFKYTGRILLIMGVAIDTISIVRASNPIRRASEVATAWAMASAGCRTVGGAALAATPPHPLVKAGAGVVGCIIGGGIGYYSGTALGGTVYDWAESTVFFPLPEAPSP